MTSRDQDIRQSLARAFDRAWYGFYRSGRLTVSQDVARTELARTGAEGKTKVKGEMDRALKVQLWIIGIMFFIFWIAVQWLSLDG